MENNDIELLTQAEKNLARAHLSMDIDVIDNLLHKDYVIVQPGGKLETKEDVLASYKSGNRHWKSAEVSELDMKLYVNVARVVGIWRASGMNNGESFNYQARFISIWIKEESNWKNISYSSSEIK